MIVVPLFLPYGRRLNTPEGQSGRYARAKYLITTAKNPDISSQEGKKSHIASRKLDCCMLGWVQDFHMHKSRDVVRAALEKI